MGIEQILLPILGGIAKGTGAGMEQNRQERVQREAQRDAITARHLIGNYEAMQAPEMQRFMVRYWGKDEAKAQMAIAKIKHFEGMYRNEQLKAGNVSPDPMPADYMPMGGTEPVDFSPASPGGIMGLISRFVPGADKAMSALRIGQGGTALAGPQGMPDTSTGPASGPQGYPAGGGPMAMPQAGSSQAQAQVAQQALQAQGRPGGREGGVVLTPRIVGKMPSGRPIVDNGDGTFSSHKNMIAGFGDKFYIVPTIYGGKQVTPDQAAQIARQNRLTDPDTGQALQGFATQQEAEQAEQEQHAVLEQEMKGALGGGALGSERATSQVPTTKVRMTPGGMTLTTSGGFEPGGNLRPNPKYGRVRKLGEGVTLSVDKDGNEKFSITNPSPNLDSPTGRARQMRKAAGYSGDLDDPGELREVLDWARDIETLRVFDQKKNEAIAEGNPTIMAIRERVAERLTRIKTRAQEEEKLGVESSPLALDTRKKQSFQTAFGAGQGAAASNLTEIPGTGITPQQSELNQARDKERMQRQESPLGEGQANRQVIAEGIVAGSENINKLFKDEYVGAVKGANFFVDFRKKLGQMKGPEAKFWQSVWDVVGNEKYLRTGQASNEAETALIMRSMFDPTGTPETFRAELDQFLERAKQTVAAQKRIYGEGRDTALNPDRGPAPAGRTPAPNVPEGPGGVEPGMPAVVAQPQGRIVMDPAMFKNNTLPPPPKIPGKPTKAEAQAFVDSFTPEGYKLYLQMRQNNLINDKTKFIAPQ